MQKVKLYKNNGHVFITASDCVTTMGYRLQLANCGSMFMCIEQVDSIVHVYSWPMLSVWVLTESIQSIVFLYTQSQKVERLQSEMKTQEQQMEDIDGAKQKITVSALSLNSHTYLLYLVLPCSTLSQDQLY